MDIEEKEEDDDDMRNYGVQVNEVPNSKRYMSLVNSLNLIIYRVYFL